MEYPKCDQEKIMWKFQGSVFGIGISKGSNTIPWNIQGLSLILSGISKVKVKKWKTPGFSKKYILKPRLDFFSETAQYTDDRMGNAPNILCLECKEHKESQS